MLTQKATADRQIKHTLKLKPATKPGNKIELQAKYPSLGNT